MARRKAKSFTDLIRFRGRPKPQYVPGLRRINNGPRPAYGYPRKAAPDRGGSPQRVIVKVHYFSPGRFPTHARYLESEGKGRDGGKPELFTRTERSQS